MSLDAEKLQKDRGEPVVYRVDFTAHLDCVVSVGINKESFGIEILAYGDSEEALDAGFPIYCKDGSLAFPVDFPLFPEEFPNFPVSKVRCFSYMQTAFLKVCIESYRAVQMLESNPCLLWLMLHLSNQKSLGSAQVHCWLGEKRKSIIREITGVEVDGSEKFLSKLVLLTGEKNELDLVGRAVSDPGVVSAYSHWANIPVQALYISERYPDLQGADYLLDWCSKNKKRMSNYLSGVSALNKLTGDAVRLGRELNIKNSMTLVKACKTVDQLNKLHDKWVVSLNRSRKYYDPDVEFSRPNIGQCKGVLWVSSANSLIDEGAEMEHCVATYVDRVRTGISIIFSVFYPERATLEVSFRENRYVLVEIKRERNLEVDGKTRSYVEDWLRRENDELSKT